GYLCASALTSPVTDDHGGFEHARENVDGHPMVSLLGYAKRYWPTLTLGALAHKYPVTWRW
ncbi:hypothetical protein DJ68_04335, partial [Halorubrum sp. C3]